MAWQDQNPTPPDLVAPESPPLHPLSWLAVPLMLLVGVGGSMVKLVALALPLFLR